MSFWTIYFSVSDINWKYIVLFFEVSYGYKKSNLKLILTMGIPPILSMLIQSLYSIVDGIFVGQISDAAFNAISIAYPITNLTLALAVGFGVGINSLMARSLGAGDKKKARKTADTYLVCSVCHYLIFIILGLSIIPFSFRGLLIIRKQLSLVKNI